MTGRLPPPNGSAAAAGSSHPHLHRHKFFRRLVQLKQMDFEFALWQLANLVVAPAKVYQNSKYNKALKQQWARDDPAFVVLLALCLCLTSIGCAAVFRLPVLDFFGFLLWVVSVDFIGTGLVVATLFWWISNKFLRKSGTDQQVEWAFCFDVHCNAFVPLVLILHFVQLFLVKIVTSDGFFGALVANALWVVALGYYFYITFLGYGTLSVLDRTGLFLYPIAVVLLLFVVAVIARFNWSLAVFRWYGFL